MPLGVRPNATVASKEFVENSLSAARSGRPKGAPAAQIDPELPQDIVDVGIAKDIFMSIALLKVG